MNLFILTKSDGSPIADKTVAAVTSVTDSTVVDDIGNLVLGDSEPLVIKFTTGTAAPSFAGDATYGLTVALGAVTPEGTSNYSSTSTFSTVTGGWSGRLSTNTEELISAINIAGGGGNWNCGPQNAGPRGGWLALQIRVTDPSGYTTTFALLRVFVEWRVTSAGEAESAQGELMIEASAAQVLAGTAADPYYVSPRRLAGAIPTAITVTFTGTPVAQILIASSPEIFTLTSASVSGTALARKSGKTISQFVYLESTSALQSKGLGLTTISLDDVYAISSGNGIQLLACPRLTSFSAPALVYCGGIIQITTNPLLTTLSLPLLESVGSTLNIGTNALLATLSLATLRTVTTDFTISTMASLTTLTLTALESIGRTVAINTLGSLTTISMPALTRIGNTTTIATAASLTTISMPALVSLGGTFTATTSLGAIANVTFGAVGTLKEAFDISFSGQALTSASVNHILAVIASLDGTNGTASWGTGRTLTLSGGTNAAPSGQGITDKATIQARGATVNTN